MGFSPLGWLLLHLGAEGDMGLVCPQTLACTPWSLPLLTLSQPEAQT